MATKKYVNLSNLSTFLSSLRETFAALRHTHTISEISDYAVDSSLSPNSTNPVQNKVLDAEFDAISTAMDVLESAIDGKSDASHAHNDLYYTEEEVDNLLAPITTTEIDEICGAQMTVATLDNEVTF